MSFSITLLYRKFTYPLTLNMPSFTKVHISSQHAPQMLRNICNLVRNISLDQKTKKQKKKKVPAMVGARIGFCFFWFWLFCFLVFWLFLDLLFFVFLDFFVIFWCFFWFCLSFLFFFDFLVFWFLWFWVFVGFGFLVVWLFGFFWSTKWPCRKCMSSIKVHCKYQWC